MKSILSILVALALTACSQTTDIMPPSSNDLKPVTAEIDRHLASIDRNLGDIQEALEDLRNHETCRETYSFHLPICD